MNSRASGTLMGTRAATRARAEAPTAPVGALLFLTGWPACGIAEFGSWLAQRRGYRHLDLEETHPADGAWRAMWYQHLPDKAEALARDLLNEAERWVVTAEHPADQLPHLGPLRDAGFGLWFLQPRMEGYARQRWQARERELDPAVKPAGWDKLADAIRKNARALRPHFRDRCVEALAADGQVDFEALAAIVGALSPAAPR